MSRAAAIGYLVALSACGPPSPPAEGPAATVDVGMESGSDEWVDDEGRSVATDEPSTPLPNIEKELRVRIDTRGHIISVDGAVVAWGCRHTAPSTTVTVPLRNGSHDTQAFARCLEQLKKDNPSWDEAILVAEPDIRYAIVVQTLDVLRGDHGERFSSVAFGVAKP